MIYFSNHFSILAERLAQTLSQEMAHPFEETVILVPSDRYKRTLQQYFATDSRFRIAMGMNIQTLSEYLASFRGVPFPSFGLMQARLYAEGRKLLQGYSDEQIKIMSCKLAHLFYKYGAQSKFFLDKWLQKQTWQQELWKRLFEEGTWSYPSKILAAIQSVSPLPHLFGFSSLPTAYALFFKRIGAKFYLFSPCRLFWTDLQERDEGCLLGSLGRYGMRLLNTIAAEEMVSDEEYQEPREDHTLGALQQAVLNLEPLAHEEELHQTIQIFSAGHRRQEVEEIFERIAKLLQQREDLTPADILVLTPDLPNYTPHIQAVFQKNSNMFGYRILGLERKAFSPIAQGIFLLFNLIEEKWDLTALLHLFAHPSFAKKRKWGKEEIELIERWLSSAKMTWGLDAEQRKVFLQSEEEQSSGTLRFALDRCLLGLCITDSSSCCAINIPKPCPIIDWSDIDLFAELIRTVEELDTDLKSAVLGAKKPLKEWFLSLSIWIERHFVQEEDWVKEEIEMLVETCRGCDEEIYSWHDLKGFCEEIFQKKTESYQRNLLESICFDLLDEGTVLDKKVIILIGMHEGGFPRIEEETSLDQMEPRLPSRGEIDRFLFLECLLKAQEMLLISFLHTCPQKEIELPPSLVVQELKNYFADQGIQIATQRLNEHSFSLEALQKAPYFSLSRYRAAKAFYNHRQDCEFIFAEEWQKTRPLSASLVSIQSCTVDISDLKMLFRDPVEFFFKKNLGMTIERKEESAFYEEEFYLNKFEREDLIKRGLTNSLQALLEQREREKGLPFGLFRKITEDRLIQEIEEKKSDLQRLNISPASIQDIEIVPWKIEYDEGTTITLKGTIQDVLDCGLLEIFKPSKAALSIWKRWPEIIILSGHPELKTIPNQVVLSYAKRKAIRDFPEICPLDELRKVLRYYFLSLHRLSPLYPKWVDSILAGDTKSLEKKIQEERQSRFIKWLIRRDGYPNAEVLCETWSTFSKEIFENFYEL